MSPLSVMHERVEMLAWMIRAQYNIAAGCTWLLAPWRVCFNAIGQNGLDGFRDRGTSFVYEYMGIPVSVEIDA